MRFFNDNIQNKPSTRNRVSNHEKIYVVVKPIHYSLHSKSKTQF